MKQISNYKIIGLVVLLIATFSSITALAQRFKKHEVCLPDKGILTATVKIWPPYIFSIKNASQVTWAKYEISDNFVFFSTPVNTTKSSRECIFVLHDGEGNPVDTLKLTQLGKVTSTTSKVAGSLATHSKSVIASKKTSSSSSSSGQCAARTKKGTRCSRKAAAGSIYCWQHNK